MCMHITVCSTDAGSLDWVHICRTSSKVVTFIDLAGHEKYLKTTIFGMTGHAPDFCMLMVGSNAGIIGMTKGQLACTHIKLIYREPHASNAWVASYETFLPNSSLPPQSTWGWHWLSVSPCL